jgi:hypothetical protein
MWISICNGGATRVAAVSKQSWHWGYLRGLLIPSLKDFLSFFYFPYGTSCILSIILWFPLILLVPSRCLGNSSTLLSSLSPGSRPSLSLSALHVTYLNPSFDYPLHKVASSQQVQPTQYRQILATTSCSNTPVPLFDDRLCYSASDLATLNDLLVTDLSNINTTSIQELCQALRKLVVLAQHLLENSWLRATAMVVDYEGLKQQRDQE